MRFIFPLQLRMPPARYSRPGAACPFLCSVIIDGGAEGCLKGLDGEGDGEQFLHLVWKITIIISPEYNILLYVAQLLCYGFTVNVFDISPLTYTARLNAR